MTRDELAERAIRKMAEGLGKETILRANPTRVRMRKTVCLGKTPIALFVVHENIIYWAPIPNGAEGSYQ